MVETYAYLFIGGQEDVKREKINFLKSKYLDKKLENVDFEIVYSQDKKINPRQFDEILSYPPSSKSKRRIVLIKNIESLKRENRDVLIKHLKSPAKSLILILDSSSLDFKDAFIKEIEPFVKKLIFRRNKKLGVFDLTEAITDRQTTRALKILHTLLVNREKPQSILGAIFWHWEKMKDSLSLDKFRQGLKLLLDTDIRIKTGRVEEGLALEMVVIRLSYLI